jgi:hypothetical protein
VLVFFSSVVHVIAVSGGGGDGRWWVPVLGALILNVHLNLISGKKKRV